MIRRIRKEAEELVMIVDMPVSDIVDMAVDALEAFSIMEKDYEEGTEPEENEAVCVDEEGNEAYVGVDLENGVLEIDLDEEDEIEIELNDKTADDVKAELQADLEEKLAKNEKEEARMRFEAWKRRCKMRRASENKKKVIRRMRNR